MTFPFDQYQRYSTVRDLIAGIRAELGRAHLRVLDVGGYVQLPSGRVRFPARALLPDDAPIVVDLAPCDGREVEDRDAYVRASGTALPFPDASFDVVLSCDALEHVPAPERARFLAEAARVSRRYVILTAPAASSNARLAERIVEEFVRLRLGLPQPQLLEHALHGLPEPGAVLAALREAGLDAVSFPGEDLYGWLFMMLAKHYLMALPDSRDLHDLLDRFYCASFPQGWYREDQAERCYRRFYVASKAPDDPFLLALARRLAEAPAGPASRGQPEGVGLGLSLSQLLLALATREVAPGDGEKLDVAVEGGSLVVGELADGRSIGQSFVCNRPNLCRIDLLLATYGRRNAGTVRLTLREGSPAGPEVATTAMAAAAVLDNRWCAFRFPPQPRSRHRRYYFELTHEGGSPGNSITCYHHPALRADSLVRYERGAPAEGQLCFRTYFALPTAEEERLTELEQLREEVRALADNLGRARAELDARERELMLVRSSTAYRLESRLRRLLGRKV